MTAGSSNTNSSDPGWVLSQVCLVLLILTKASNSGLFLRSSQAQKGREGGGDAEQCYGDLTRLCAVRVARQSLFPREACVGTLRAGKDGVAVWQRDDLCRWTPDFDTLVAKEVHTGSTMVSAAPILPEEWGRTNSKRMEQYADLTRLFGGAALPLALLTKRTGTATADARRIDHTETAVGLATSLLGNQGVPRWAPKSPIGLERKV